MGNWHFLKGEGDDGGMCNCAIGGDHHQITATSGGVPVQIGHASAANPFNPEGIKTDPKLLEAMRDALMAPRCLPKFNVENINKALAGTGYQMEPGEDNYISRRDPAPQKPADTPSPEPARCTPIFGKSSLSDLRKGVMACWDSFRPAGF